MGIHRPPALLGRTPEESLQGYFLVASPHLRDPNFARSVVYLCNHDADGAMGLIINRPLEAVNFADIVKQLDIPGGPGESERRVYFGGPVETGRGFILHSPDYACNETITVTERVSLTAHPCILRDLLRGEGPGKILFALGYAGWGPGQLEQEIMADDWIPFPGDEGLIFETVDLEKWNRLYELLGLDPSRIIGFQGNA